MVVPVEVGSVFWSLDKRAVRWEVAVKKLHGSVFFERFKFICIWSYHVLNPERSLDSKVPHYHVFLYRLTFAQMIIERCSKFSDSFVGISKPFGHCCRRAKYLLVELDNPSESSGPTICFRNWHNDISLR